MTIKPDSLEGLRMLADEHARVDPDDWKFGDGTAFDIRACLRWAVEQVEAAQSSTLAEIARVVGPRLSTLSAVLDVQDRCDRETKARGPVRSHRGLSLVESDPEWSDMARINAEVAKATHETLRSLEIEARLDAAIEVERAAAASAGQSRTRDAARARLAALEAIRGYDGPSSATLLERTMPAMLAALEHEQQACEGTNWPRHKQIGEAIAALQSIL